MVELFELGGRGGGSTCHVRASTKDFLWGYSTKAKREIPITKNADGTKREIAWRTKAWRLKPSTLLAATRGKDRVSVSGITHTALLTVDVDMHLELDAGRRAELAVLPIEALRAAVAGFVVHVETTPRGYHASVILERPVPVARAAELADLWARAASATAGCEMATGVILESFPKIQHGGTGRGCALPIGKGQRIVGGDLLTNRHRTRAADLRSILDGERVDPTMLAARLIGLPTVTELPKGRALLVLVDEPGTVRGADGQLFKEDFVLECLRLLEEGIDDDESWHAVRIMVGACKYAGLSDDETRSAMGAWLKQDGHRATHCQSSSGIRELENKVRGQLRYFRRGLLGERCHENGMDAPRLRGLLYGLAGEAVREVAPEHRKRRPWLQWARKEKPVVPAHLIGTEMGEWMAA
jgi:hypothetical protein